MDNKVSPIIEQIHDLPDGTLITGKGEQFELPESQRLNVAVWRLIAKRASWVLYTSEAKKQATLLQMLKLLRDKNEPVEHIILIQDGVLKSIYERADREYQEKKISGNLNDSHVIKLFTQIMSYALMEKASDIHIEKRQEQANIKIRKNGEIISLRGYEVMSPTDATELCAVIYNVLAESDSKEVAFNETLIQQGAIKMSIPIGDTFSEVKLRFQSVPVYPNGFDVVMRILPVGRNERYVTLEELGYEQSQVKIILECISKSVGAMIIAGVTGSGKSTTLKSLLMWMCEDRGFSEKVFTVEDPPEYIIPNVSQIPVARRKDDIKEGRKPFEDAIKACMRADPDVIMVGEIRDNTTGDLLKKAVQSGHRVLTTVHAPSALGVVDRLLDFGLSPSTLASQEFIAGLVYQRLLAKLCVHCSTPLIEAVASTKAPKALLDLYRRIEKTLKDAKENNINEYINKIRLRGTGCSHCQQGVIGRTVCAEIVKPDLHILQAFQQQNILAALQYLRDKISDNRVTSRNMVGKSAMAHAFVKMLNGEVDPIELERSFGIISLSEITGLSELHTDDYKDDEFASF